MSSPHSSELEDDEVTFHPRHLVKSPPQHGSPVYDVISSKPTLDNVCLVTDSRDYHPPIMSHQYALRSRGRVFGLDQATHKPTFRDPSRRVEFSTEPRASDDCHVGYVTDHGDRRLKPPMTELNSDSELYRKGTKYTHCATSSVNLLAGIVYRDVTPHFPDTQPISEILSQPQSMQAWLPRQKELISNEDRVTQEGVFPSNIYSDTSCDVIHRDLDGQNTFDPYSQHQFAFVKDQTTSNTIKTSIETSYDPRTIGTRPTSYSTQKGAFQYPGVGDTRCSIVPVINPEEMRETRSFEFYRGKMNEFHAFPRG